MTITNLVNTFEGGSDATAITAGNSGGASGDAFTAVTANCTFSSAQKMHGSLSMVITNPAATSATARWAIASQPKVAARQYMYLTTLPGADLWLYKTQSTTATAAALRVQGTNKLRLATNGVDRWTAAAAISATTWYRTEVFLDAGTSNVTGKYQVAYYLGDSASAIEDSGLISGQDVASTAFINTYHGFSGGASYAGTIYLDDIAVTSGASGDTVGLIGASVNAAPTLTSLTVGGSTNWYGLAGTSVALSARFQDSDGTITSAQWEYRDDDAAGAFTAATWTSLSTSTSGLNTNDMTATASDTPPAGVRQYRCRVADNLGGLQNGTALAYAYPASDVDVAVRSVTLGSWVNAGTAPAATATAALNDNADGSWIETPAGPSAVIATVVMDPFGPGVVKLWPKWQLDSTSPTVPDVATVYKSDGTTQAYQTTQSGHSTTAAEELITVDTTGNTTLTGDIAGRGAVVVKFSATTN